MSWSARRGRGGRRRSSEGGGRRPGDSIARGPCRLVQSSQSRTGKEEGRTEGRKKEKKMHAGGTGLVGGGLLWSRREAFLASTGSSSGTRGQQTKHRCARATWSWWDRPSSTRRPFPSQRHPTRRRDWWR